MRAFSYAGAADAVRDPDHALVKYVGARVTPEAAVYAGGRIVYRGRIDDRYVDLGVERPQATRRDLAEAIASVVAGQAVTQPKTQAVGCFIADFKR
jgi:ribosomal protein L35AE/L33A